MTTKIFSKKNLTFLIIESVIFLFFLIFAGLSWPALIITAAGVLGFYLYFAKIQNELLLYSSLCAISFILLYLAQMAILPSWLILIFLAFAFYLLLNFFSDILGKNQFYVIILVLILTELSFGANFLTIPILAKSLIIVVCFYLFSGIIKLNIEKKLKFKPVAVFVLIFVIILSLLLFTRL